MRTVVFRWPTRLLPFQMAFAGLALIACSSDSPSLPPSSGTGTMGNAGSGGASITGNGGDATGSAGTNGAGGAQQGSSGSAGTAGAMTAGAGGTTPNGGSVADAGSPITDAGMVVQMHPGQCIYPPNLSQRKAPAWPPTKITNPTGL